jgi:hypothetical protein
MSRRPQVSALVSGFVIVILLTVAASSGPYGVWVTPSSEVKTVSEGADQASAVEPEPPVSSDQLELPNWLGGALEVLGAAVAALGLVMVVAFGVFGRLPLPRWRGSRWRQAANVGKLSALPAVDERSLAIDVASARAALSAGSPRNAIVACWMQLERDAAAAGLQRLAAETSAEYVERVVASSSVDPAPIGELAALYREARFSVHPLDDDHRDRAASALDRVADELGRAAGVPA